MKTSRRSFLRSLGLLSGALGLGAGHAPGDSPRPSLSSKVGPRPSGSTYMGGFRAPKLDTVKLAFVGLSRGFTHVSSACALPGVSIVAVCDLVEHRTQGSAKAVAERTGQTPKTYGKDAHDYRRMLAECRPDAVVISTDWASHAPIACDCMRAGAHAFVEVPFSQSLEEIQQLVDTSEATKQHCMLLENVNYGREELLFLNMVRSRAIGELLHGEAAYIHTLRDALLHDREGEGAWRPGFMTQINGNLYPTHGLGPVAQYMNLARRDDTFDYLVSVSSPALGAAAHAKNKLPADHKWNKTRFVCGDINNTLIKTRAGRSILVQWDETTPRPYSRLNLIQGTKGVLAGFPTRVAGEELGKGNFHEWIQGEGMQAIYETYEHPLWKRLGAQAEKHGGHGGMDFIMMARIVECLRQGEPLDQNVYEGAFWSAVGPLSALSVGHGGAPVPFPDFTRGGWETTEPLAVIP